MNIVEKAVQQANEEYFAAKEIVMSESRTPLTDAFAKKVANDKMYTLPDRTTDYCRAFGDALDQLETLECNFELECQDADRVLSLFHDIQRTEGGRLPVAKLINAICDQSARCKRAEEAILATQSELSAARRDAERYRWLRDRPSFIGWDWWQPPVPQETWIDGAFMDKMIDEQLDALSAKEKA